MLPYIPPCGTKKKVTFGFGNIYTYAINLRTYKHCSVVWPSQMCSFSYKSVAYNNIYNDIDSLVSFLKLQT